MKPQAIEIPVRLDPKALAEMRLLLSQLGFAIDNYLLSQAQSQDKSPTE